MKNRSIAVAAVLCLGAVSMTGLAQELIYLPKKTMGVNIIPPEKNRWRAKIIRLAEKPDRGLVTDRKDKDFFLLEYGEHLKPFELDLGESGTASCVWGEKVGERRGGAIRYGRGWAGCLLTWVGLRAQIDQTCAGEVTWTLVLHERKSKREICRFKTQQGANEVRQDLDLLMQNRLYYDGGLELTAVGEKGAKLRVSSFRLAPLELPFVVRRTFELKEEPWRAGVSFRSRQGQVLKVNGKSVPLKERKLTAFGYDLTGLLHKGTNVIAYGFNADEGWDREAATAIEVFAVNADGTTAFFPSDESWEVRVVGGKWEKAVTRHVFGLDQMPNGTWFSNGWLPLHAGALDPRPSCGEWPVFDCDGEVAYEVKAPPDLKGATVVAMVRDAFTTAVVERVESAVGKVRLATRKAGAYEIGWQLRTAAGRVVDSLTSEMIVAGPVKLDEGSCDDVDRMLSERLELVDEIDCTADAPEDKMLDHSGYYTHHKTNVGRVIVRDGFKVRETGPQQLDILSWRIHCGRLGEPHIAEVEFPDTREQQLFASVSETYTVPFVLNSSSGSRSWPSGSGAAISGGSLPLSGKMKTMRFVFFPSTETTTFNAESYVPGKPAALSRVRIYQVRGSLPALRLPKTDRLFGNHNEQPIFFNWGNSVIPFMHEVFGTYREGAWAAAYKALVNRIQFLKFAGHNASIEGAFMYDFGFQTRSGETSNTNPEYDLLIPLIKMYRHNAIKLFLGYEYIGTPNLLKHPIRDVSDREVAAGKPTLSFVDRHGQQVFYRLSGGGMNFLNPLTTASMTGLMKEIYDRYEPLGGIEGVVLQTDGCCWQPTFTVSLGQDPDEIGYDDLTIGLFEKETGVKLGVAAKGAERFNARYERLHADATLLERWRNWRFDKVRAAHERLASVVRARTPWRYLVSPQVTSQYDANGYTSERYPTGRAVELLPGAAYQHDWRVDTYADVFSPAVHARTKACDSLYLAPYGLEENNVSSVDAAKRWWWRSYGVIVYDLKPAGENAFFDCTLSCKDHTPRLFLHTWLDVNVPTAFNEESRRFLSGFYATPTGEGVPWTKAKGVTARVYGGKLQLLNLTPYPIVGELEGVGAVELRPFDIRVFDRPAAGRFEFADESRETVAEFLRPMGDSVLRGAIPAEALVRYDAAETQYDRVVCAREYEIFSRLQRFDEAKDYAVRQRALEDALRRDGVVRVNCGQAADLVDELGRKWLGDQKYTGFKAYGGEKSVWASRGDIPILKTKTPSIYRTEGSGSRDLVYRFPVPEGSYRVILHIADTYNKQDIGAVWKVRIGSDVRSFSVWKLAGGTGCTATQTVFENVRPQDGEIKIDLPCAVLNGVEIVRL